MRTTAEPSSILRVNSFSLCRQADKSFITDGHKPTYLHKSFFISLIISYLVICVCREYTMWPFQLIAHHSFFTVLCVVFARLSHFPPVLNTCHGDGSRGVRVMVVGRPGHKPWRWKISPDLIWGSVSGSIWALPPPRPA